MKNLNSLLKKVRRKTRITRPIAHNLRILFFIVLCVTIGIMLQILVLLSNEYSRVKSLYKNKHSEYVYWTTLASQYPNIPDILFNTAVSAVSFGKRDEAIKLLEKSLSIDPLFKEAERLKEKIFKM